MRMSWPLVFQVLVVFAALWLVVYAWQVWLLVFTALIFAAAILPAARLGERYHVPRAITVLFVYLAVAGLFGLMGRLVWPLLSEQGRQFMEQLPQLIQNMHGWGSDIEAFLGRWGVPMPTPKTDTLPAMLGTVLANTFRVTAGAVGALVGLFAIVVIAAYFVIDADRIGAVLLTMLPREQRPVAATLAVPVLDRIGGYVRGQLVSSFFLGAVIAIILALLGVRYSLLIGALAAVLNIVPFVGVTVAGVLAVLSALNQSVSLAVFVFVAMMVVQAIEGKFLAPHFVGHATGLHPLAVLLALLLGIHLAGLIGALVAVSAVAGLWEIIRTLWIDPDRS